MSIAIVVHRNFRVVPARLKVTHKTTNRSRKVFGFMVVSALTKNGAGLNNVKSMIECAQLI